MKHTPQYLFQKYGKRIFAEWDYSYDEENDEDVEYSETELLDVVRELIVLGADVNVVEEDGDTPLHHFVCYFDILKMLVEEYGVDVKVLDHGNYVCESIIYDDRVDVNQLKNELLMRWCFYGLIMEGDKNDATSCCALA